MRRRHEMEASKKCAKQIHSVNEHHWINLTTKTRTRQQSTRARSRRCRWWIWMNWREKNESKHSLWSIDSEKTATNGKKLYAPRVFLCLDLKLNLTIFFLLFFAFGETLLVYRGSAKRFLLKSISNCWASIFQCDFASFRCRRKNPIEQLKLWCNSTDD